MANHRSEFVRKLGLLLGAYAVNLRADMNADVYATFDDPNEEIVHLGWKVDRQNCIEASEELE